MYSFEDLFPRVDKFAWFSRLIPVKWQIPSSVIYFQQFKNKYSLIEASNCEQAWQGDYFPGLEGLKQGGIDSEMWSNI